MHSWRGRARTGFVLSLGSRPAAAAPLRSPRARRPHRSRAPWLRSRSEVTVASDKIGTSPAFPSYARVLLPLFSFFLTPSERIGNRRRTLSSFPRRKPCERMTSTEQVGPKNHRPPGHHHTVPVPPTRRPGPVPCRPADSLRDGNQRTSSVEPGCLACTATGPPPGRACAPCVAGSFTLRRLHVGRNLFSPAHNRTMRPRVPCRIELFPMALTAYRYPSRAARGVDTCCIARHVCLEKAVTTS